MPKAKGERGRNRGCWRKEERGDWRRWGWKRRNGRRLQLKEKMLRRRLQQEQRRGDCRRGTVVGGLPRRMPSLQLGSVRYGSRLANKNNNQTAAACCVVGKLWPTLAIDERQLATRIEMFTTSKRNCYRKERAKLSQTRREEKATTTRL